MLTDFRKKNKTLASTDDYNFEAELSATGSPGVYLEGGRYHVLQYSTIFKYLDYGIAYKLLRGKENFEGQLVSTLDNAVTATPSGKNKYSEHYANAYFNLNHVWQLSDYNFVQNSIGVNVDYAVSSSRSSNYGVAGVDERFPSNPVAQLHYKIGYGMKLNSSLVLIPMLETPILTGYSFDNGRSTLEFFSSRYRPVIFTLRFLYIRGYSLEKCIPVKNPDLPGGQVIPDGMDR